jgi:nicotinamidase-related amidase
MKTEFTLDDYCHVAIDMQRLFAEETVWKAPALGSILDNVAALSRQLSSNTLFARFVVPASLEDAHGCWRQYYERWSMLTGDRHDPTLHDLVEPLKTLAKPEQIFDKPGFSIFSNKDLDRRLRRNGIKNLIFSGVETDVCVYSSVLEAIDLGYRVIIATDAVASTEDAAHRAVLDCLAPRLPEQILLLTTKEILNSARTTVSCGPFVDG